MKPSSSFVIFIFLIVYLLSLARLLLSLERTAAATTAVKRRAQNIYTSTNNTRITYLEPTINADCSSLFAGDAFEIERVRNLLNRLNNNSYSSEEQLLHDMVSCPNIAPSFQSNFYISQAEQQFPIAFVILIHYQRNSIQQYMRLLRFLYRPHNIYCLHIDQKAPKYWIQTVETFASCFDNILIAQDAVKVVYSSPATLTAHLSCLRELYSSGHPWKYVIDLHGTELPLVTNRDIVNELQRLQPPINVVPAAFNYSRITRAFTRREMTYKAKIVNNSIGLTKDKLSPPPYNLTLYKSADCANSGFSREFVYFILTSQKAIALYEYLQDVMVAEEFFFCTMNSLPEAPGGLATKIKSSYRLPKVSVRLFDHVIKYDPFLCRGEYFRHRICIVSSADLPRLKKISEARTQFFHNKYLVDYDHVVMDCMEELLLLRNKEESVQAVSG